MKQITLPDKISITDKGENRYQVIIEPCYPGYGITLSNSLRRVMLSSLGGGAVTSFKIEGAQHEFDSVDYVKEDLVEIMLNLKKLRVKVFADEPVRLNLSAKGEKVVTAAEIAKNAQVEIINKDLVIATLTDKQAKFNMEIVVENGLGYETVEQRETSEKLEIGNIAIDASFSPVLNVGYETEHVRVGKMTNYEKLTFDILTDGTLDARTALSKAALILRDHFNWLISPEAETPVAEAAGEVKKPKKTPKVKKEKEDKKTK
jgi:DNA-directed RNA polymerase subunit alpha